MAKLVNDVGRNAFLSFGFVLSGSVFDGREILFCGGANIATCSSVASTLGKPAILKVFIRAQFYSDVM